MEKYGVIIWLVLTAILLLIGFGRFLLWFFERLRKTGEKAQDFVKDKMQSRQVKKTLEEKKEVILNHEKQKDPDSDDDFHEVIEEVMMKLEEAEEVLESDFQVSTSQKSDVLSEKMKQQLERIIFDAEFLKQSGKFEEYEKKIIEGLALSPTHLELTKMLADLYFTTGTHKKALSLLKKIIERDPQAHRSLWQIGEIYYINGDLNSAEFLIEKAMKIRPENPKYLLGLVEIYYNTDRVKDAIEMMERVVKLRPANASYLQTLAEFYEEIYDFVNAKKYYFSILELEPGHEKAKKKLKTLGI